MSRTSDVTFLMYASFFPIEERRRHVESGSIMIDPATSLSSSPHQQRHRTTSDRDDPRPLFSWLTDISNIPRQILKSLHISATIPGITVKSHFLREWPEPSLFFITSPFTLEFYCGLYVLHPQKSILCIHRLIELWTGTGRADKALFFFDFSRVLCDYDGIRPPFRKENNYRRLGKRKKKVGGRQV